MTTLKVSPLTRVEGHGEVELVLRKGRLREARALITESPRLFEGLLVGKSLFEVPALICRICAICSSVHRVAACQALESALDTEIPPAAEKIRELLLLGGHIESHALHLFCLILPDLEGGQSILELLKKGSARAREGLALKALANRLQEAAGGRVIHPVNVEVGGVLGLPDRKRMETLLGEITQRQQGLEKLLTSFFDPRNYPPSSDAVGTRIAVCDSDGYSLTGRRLALSDGRRVEGSRYRELLAERTVPYSNARHSGAEGSPFLTGALARLEIFGKEGAAPPGAERVAGGIHGNNGAQAVETTWALRRSRELVEELLSLEENVPLRSEARAKPGVGTAVIEAPRGLLVHHYGIDDMGRIAAADIVTPTAINQRAIEAQILADLVGTGDRKTLVTGSQRIVRSFDPCISCSVHLLEI